jgi:polyisoprenoid-binding protein YceI
MKKLITAFVLSLFTLPAMATTYVIDPNHTLPTFEYDHFGLAQQRGMFAKTEGTITFDPAKKKGSADITIHVDSVTTGVPKFDEHLKSADFFDAAKYPTITFKSKKFTFEGDQLVEVAGDLTMHGVKKPVTLKVNSWTCKEHPIRKVPACGANAVAVIKRSDFGMGLYAPAVSDEVTLRIGVEAHKKP